MYRIENNDRILILGIIHAAGTLIEQGVSRVDAEHLVLFHN